MRGRGGLAVRKLGDGRRVGGKGSGCGGQERVGRRERKVGGLWEKRGGVAGRGKMAYAEAGDKDVDGFASG